MNELLGRRALVTGAGTRVGAAIATRLGAAGMRVAVHYHGSADGARRTCRAITEAGGEACPFRADLYRRQEARRLVDAVTDAWGGLDLLVASAANYDRVAFDNVDDTAWDRALDLNLSAPFWLAHRARQALRDSGGNIVFITCTSPAAPYRHRLPYVVSKSGLSALARVLALELAPEVRVNAIAPGTVLPPPDMSAAHARRIEEQIPLGRVGRAEDVADAVVYLATAPFVTGHELVVDGGRSVGRPDDPEA